jgi:hypothetical protein
MSKKLLVEYIPAGLVGVGVAGTMEGLPTIVRVISASAAASAAIYGAYQAMHPEEITVDDYQVFQESPPEQPQDIF